MPHRELLGHTGGVLGAVFTPDGSRVLTGSSDGTLRAWDTTTATIEKTSASLGGGLAQFYWGTSPALALSRDATRLLAVYTNGTFRFWNTAHLDEGPPHPLPVASFSCAAVSPHGEQAAFAGEEGRVLLWDPKTEEAYEFARPARRGFFRMAYSENGRWLALAGETGISVWELAARNECCSFSRSTAPQTTMSSLVFSPDSERLLAGFFDGKVKAWRLDKPDQEMVLKGLDHQVNGLVMLSDARTVVGTSRQIAFWEVGSGQLSREPWTPRETVVHSCALSSDGRRLVTGEAFGIIRVWDLVTGRELLRLAGDLPSVRRLGFLPDGETLVSVSEQSIHLWKQPPASYVADKIR